MIGDTVGLIARVFKGRMSGDRGFSCLLGVQFDPSCPVFNGD